VTTNAIRVYEARELHIQPLIFFQLPKTNANRSADIVINQIESHYESETEIFTSFPNMGSNHAMV